ncbi:c-type cytochrome [Marinicella sp. W31]|uniref:c-type cytochrome n=1 Tax=Marinicella sp. W31 TaxID=3023713 RepID=UPI00375795A6
MSDQDSIFFRNFSLLVFGLFVFIILIAVVSGFMNSEIYAEVEGQKDRTAIQESIKSVAAVNTDPNAQPVVQAVATAIAFDGSLDGQMIYDNVCMACHTTGAGGAPKLEAAAWENRMDQGLEAMVVHAIEGYQGEAGIMPAKGGRSDLSDEQVQVAVEYMLDNLN